MAYVCDFRKRQSYVAQHTSETCHAKKYHAQKQTRATLIANLDSLLVDNDENSLFNSVSMGLASLNEEFNACDLPDNDSIASNYHFTDDTLIGNLEILDANNDLSLCPISPPPLFERNYGDTSSEGIFSMNNNDDYSATSLPYPPPNFEQNLRMDHDSTDNASIQLGDNNAPVLVSEIRNNIENAKVFFNIQSEGSSIGTSDDLSLHYARNPVDFNPELLDYHSDNASFPDSHRINSKIRLAYLRPARGLSTYIPE